MTRRGITLAILLTLCFCFPPAWAQLRPVKRPSQGMAPIQHLKEVEQRVFRLTNEARRKQGLPPLTLDPALAATALTHTGDMLRRHFFSHVNPDGQSPHDRLIPAYANTVARDGENIWSGFGYDYSDSKLMARVIVDSWMSSPGHRANILNPDFSRTGVGVAMSGSQVRATQNFVQLKR